MKQEAERKVDDEPGRELWPPPGVVEVVGTPRPKPLLAPPRQGGGAGPRRIPGGNSPIIFVSDDMVGKAARKDAEAKAAHAAQNEKIRAELERTLGFK